MKYSLSFLFVAATAILVASMDPRADAPVRIAFVRTALENGRKDIANILNQQKITEPQLEELVEKLAENAEQREKLADLELDRVEMYHAHLLTKKDDGVMERTANDLAELVDAEKTLATWKRKSEDIGNMARRAGSSLSSSSRARELAKFECQEAKNNAMLQNVEECFHGATNRIAHSDARKIHGHVDILAALKSNANLHDQLVAQRNRIRLEHSRSELDTIKKVFRIFIGPQKVEFKKILANTGFEEDLVHIIAENIWDASHELIAHVLMTAALNGIGLPKSK